MSKPEMHHQVEENLGSEPESLANLADFYQPHDRLIKHLLSHLDITDQFFS